MTVHLSLNQQVVCKIMDQLPVYHEATTVDSSWVALNPVCYRELTKDASCSCTSKIHQRVQEVLSLEDIDIIVDLRDEWG